MKFSKAIVFAIFLVGTWSCDKPQEPEVEPPQVEAPAEPEKAPEADGEAKPEEALAKVEVAEAGSKFDPAVKAEQLPDGAWYCDMGTVHWASSAKPEDGKCPECGMALKQLAANAPAAEAHGEHGHDHGDHKH